MVIGTITGSIAKIAEDIQFLVPLGVICLVLVAELLHLRRSRRIAFLAYGPIQSARVPALIAAPVRAIACGVLCWGLLVLLQIDTAQWQRTKDTARDFHHLLIALDVSPSMQLEDAGPSGKQTRADRARDVLQSILDRIDLRGVRVSIVAYYTSARPVVVDTTDRHVVDNILGDLPLEQAFEAGKTDLFAAIDEAARLGRRWPPGSATFVMIGDGDSLPAAEKVDLPSAFTGRLILGVGDPYRGKFIHDHVSRQDSKSLRRLALWLHGQYNNSNVRHVPSDMLSGIDSKLAVNDGRRLSRRTTALWVVAISAISLAMVSPALALAAWLIGRVAGFWNPIQRRSPRQLVWR